MKVVVDRALCIGSGECVLSAPAVFDQEDDGTVIVLVDPPDPSQEGAVREAAHACPAKVILVTD